MTICKDSPTGDSILAVRETISFKIHKPDIIVMFLRDLREWINLKFMTTTMQVWEELQMKVEVTTEKFSSPISVHQDSRNQWQKMEAMIVWKELMQWHWGKHPWLSQEELQLRMSQLSIKVTSPSANLSTAIEDFKIINKIRLTIQAIINKRINKFNHRLLNEIELVYHLQTGWKMLDNLNNKWIKLPHNKATMMRTKMIWMP